MTFDRLLFSNDNRSRGGWIHGDVSTVYSTSLTTRLPPITGNTLADIGSTIGHYKITRQIGQGGMGVVYQAMDLRINRPVAIKLLPDELVTDEEALVRFEREILAAGKLNHPSIYTIFDVGTEDGVPYMVMEYLEGTTLRNLLLERSFSPIEVLEIAEQLVSALIYAHKHGVIHRDIKPANIFITNRGHAKLLDFGLAKVTLDLFSDSQSINASADTSTQHSFEITEKGVALGTVLYMSPEQAKGQELDERSDLFSLGSVIYELVTGLKPFPGETSALVFDGILNREPPAPSIIAGAEAGLLDDIILKLLEKKESLRYQTAVELQKAIWRIIHPDDVQSAAVVTPHVSNARLWITALTLSLIVSLAFLLVSKEDQELNDQQSVTQGNASAIEESGSLDLPEHFPATSLRGRETYADISPAGNMMVFSWDGPEQDNIDLYVINIGNPVPRRLTSHPKQDVRATWSPDGESILFLRRNDGYHHLFLIDLATGHEQEVYRTDKLLFHGETCFTKDGKSIVFDQWTGQRHAHLAMLNLESKEITSLTEGEPGRQHIAPMYSPDFKKLAFLRQSTLAAGELMMLDLETQKLTRITDDGKNIQGFSWIPDSNSIVFSSNRTGRRLLWEVDVNTQRISAISGVGAKAYHPVLHAESDTLVYTAEQIQSNIWLYNVESMDERTTPVISSTVSDFDAKWSPDGKRIAFVSERDGHHQLWACNADGTSPRRLTQLDSGYLLFPQWSPDGTKILVTSSHAGDFDIFTVSADGGPLVDAIPDVTGCMIGTWSADGNSIYYSKDFNLFKLEVASNTSTLIANHSWVGHESTDGKTLYHSNIIIGAPDGWKLYKKPTDNQDPYDLGKLVHESIAMQMPQTFYTRGNTLYWLGWDENDTSKIDKPLMAIDSDSGKPRQVSVIHNLPNFYHNIDLSADGTQALIPRQPKAESDIMVFKHPPLR